VEGKLWGVIGTSEVALLKTPNEQCEEKSQLRQEGFRQGAKWNKRGDVGGL